MGVAKLTVELLPLTTPCITAIIGWVDSFTPLIVRFSVLAVPAITPVDSAVYVPAVVVGVTVPNVPVLVPPESAKAKLLLAKLATGLPLTSFTTIVTRSNLPDATVGEAKATLDSVLLMTEEVVTVTWGSVLSRTPLTVSARVLAVPTVLPVNVVV